MNSECPIEYCHAPDTKCNEGHLKLVDCPHYKQFTVSTAEQSDVDASYIFPWTGNSLGLDNINLITTYAKPSLIGLIGPFSSGKTTILATSYLILLNGLNLGDFGFAGSLTLDGWEKISSFLKFQGFDEPSFPPHTPLGQSRVPGLLHLCLREKNGKLKDILITDPPGEWFERWTDNANDDGAEGARWIANNSSHFIFLIDSETLVGDSAMKAKYALIDLAQRLASVCGERPVAIIWSKSDYEIDPILKESITKQINKLFKFKEYFDLSVKKGDRDNLIISFQSLWNWIFQSQKTHKLSITLPRTANDYFLDYRG